jgi:hypothetical protein
MANDQDISSSDSSETPLPPQSPHQSAVTANPFNENQHIYLAAHLADACVNPSYMADLWAVYHGRFVEVLRAEAATAYQIKG